MKTWFLCLAWLVASGAGRLRAAPPSPPVALAAYGPAVFPLVHRHQAAPLYVDAQDAEVVRVAAEALARDVTAITGATPAVRAATEALGRYPVIIGTLGHSRLIDQLAATSASELRQLQGQSETFRLLVVDQPLGQPGKALVVTGSDRRGTAYGVFELSRRLGVSPWYWWADVTPQPRASLYLAAGTYQSPPPTVKYRGIFLNDEDWGLQPWAARKMDPDIQDIGPTTYARLFELLLRLKANLIWPAMHPSTRAFFQYPGNPRMAERYAILVGSSHAEPMLRNNVDEWREAVMGPFDYFRNRPAVQQYWAQRVQQAAGQEAMYSLGMRGVHDSGMQGADTPAEAARMLATVLTDQRELLRRYVAPDVTTVPQVFTAYKEVLEVYDAGLKLPDDVVLAWPDDNYGYISRLSSPAEQARPGGGGVYYHASYWGRPHDYLWLSSTHPALIGEEMLKARALRADRLWVLNVGDLKPLEYNTQLFLDMAYDARPFEQDGAIPAHLAHWAQEAFGAQPAAEIQAILWEYYDLAFERRPEFMGWSQTEPTTPTQHTAYNHFYYGDEAQRRLDRYAALVQRTKQVQRQLSSARAAAYYELVYYPVVCAALLNQKFLYQDKSYWYARQHRASAADYATWAQRAYASIVRETDYYNQQLAGGKWQGIMSMHPRDLPVYAPPTLLPAPQAVSGPGWGLMPEGIAAPDSSLREPTSSPLALPIFSPWGAPTYFVDVFLTGAQAVTWRARASAPWLVLSASRGRLRPLEGQRQQRLYVGIDWAKLPRAGAAAGTITFAGGGKTWQVAVQTTGPAPSAAPAVAEANGYVALLAGHYSRKVDQAAQRWAVVHGPGRPEAQLQAQPLGAELPPAATPAVVEYDFETFTAAPAVVTVFTLPTHQPTRASRQRYGLALDDGPVQVVDFATEGRSTEWKQNVLRNNAQRQLRTAKLPAGRHTLKISLVDPGVVLDRITIDLGGLRPAYGTVPETRRPNQPWAGPALSAKQG